MLGNRIIASLIFCVLFAVSARAVPPFEHTPWPKDGRTCFVNHEAMGARRASMMRYAPGFAPAISPTTYTVLVLRVDFTDKAMTKSKADTETFFTNLKNFYLENSYGNMTVAATVSNAVFTMPGTRPHSYYANALSSKYKELLADAVSAAQAASVSLSGYNHIMIYHAGEGAETATAPSNYIWSAYAPKSMMGGTVADGSTFSGATFVPEKEFFSVDPLGVICHEYGHQMGLPDLYSGEDSSIKVGKWSLMDYGTYLGPSGSQGSNPAHLDAWSKLFLGFCSPLTFQSATPMVATLYQAETSRTSFVRLPAYVSSVGGEKEYFLVEYRRKSGGASYDQYLPGEGILIWHIDDSIAMNSQRLADNTINTGSPHLGVKLVEADNDDVASNKGDSGDPWRLGLSFAAPQSDTFAGKESSIEAYDLSSAGNAYMTATVKNPIGNLAISNITTAGDVKVTGGKGGVVNPDKGERALIGFKPITTDSVSIKIYLVDGTLVREETTSVTANQTAIWPWNGKNKENQSVASGIYIVHIKGGGIDVKKKVAIIK